MEFLISIISALLFILVGFIDDLNKAIPFMFMSLWLLLASILMVLLKERRK